MQTFDVGEHVLNGHKFFVGRGFGYKRDETGKYHYVEHNYKVVIGEDVSIGNGTNIDIGRDRDTEIGDGTVIDSLVHIGHSAKIGKNVAIVSGAVIGGHAEIADGCYISMNVSIKQGVKIGKGSFVGMGAVVIDHVPENTVVFGVPAKPHGKRSEYVERHTHYE